MFDLDALVRDNIKNMTPYSSARDEYHGDTGVFLDANENPYGTYNRYPDPYQRELKKELSKTKHIDVENIFLGNGSDEIIDLLFKTFCRPGIDKILLFTPTYGMYKVSAQINNNEIITIPLTTDFQLNQAALETHLSDPFIKLTFICSPNNPTGNLIREKDIELLLQNSNGLVVLDEAYIDFSESSSWGNRISQYPNLVVLQTLSKAWGLAGARLGIAYASSKIIAYLNSVKPPYNISTINQQTAVQALGQKDKYRENLNKILREKERLKILLSESPLINIIYPSAANFWLVKVDDANALYASLIEKKLIIRNRHSILKNCLRITVGTMEENDTLIKGLKEINISK